jgi:Ca2+-binding EF-hand superfamily protein
VQVQAFKNLGAKFDESIVSVYFKEADGDQNEMIDFREFVLVLGAAFADGTKRLLTD